MMSKVPENILQTYKLALLGKNIQQSRSPEIYRKYFPTNLIYDLLDFENEEFIDRPGALLAKYQGLSITSPYKKVFLNDVFLSENAKKCQAINCLVSKSDGIWGENTDYLAIKDILSKFLQKNGKLNVIVLGDGAMSFVTQIVLKELQIHFRVFSRKETPDLLKLDLQDIFKSQFSSLGQKLVINTCAREFIFNGKIDRLTIFWDYNYYPQGQHNPHQQLGQSYCDGMEMLELQARYALAFWFPNKIFK